MPPLQYEPRYRPTFVSNLKGFNRHQQAIIERKIITFLTRPAYFSKSLKGILKGKREIKVGSDIRIILVWCEECQKLNQHGINDCQFCKDTDEKTIVFLMVGTHKDITKFERKMLF